MAPLEAPSEGQEQALRSIRALAKASGGRLTVELSHYLDEHRSLSIRIWLASASFPASDQGIDFEEWEPVDLAIPWDFPFKSPYAYPVRDDLDNLPHVAQGSGFCLNASPNDWDPTAGMTGFLGRLIAIYKHITRGTLSGELAPWRPPPADPEAGCVVIQADLPCASRAAGEFQLRWAIGVRVSDERVDIVRWLETPDSGEDPAADDLASELARLREEIPGALLIPAVIVPRATAIEYSDFVSDLLGLVPTSVLRDRLLDRLSLAVWVNQVREDQSASESREAGMVLVRAPADTKFTTKDSEAHFAAGQIEFSDPDVETEDGGYRAVRDRLINELPDAVIFWAQMYDGRPETVRRRDAGRPVQKVAGCRVLVLGCGALGAPIAEHCVRAGAAVVHVVDTAMVSPGILVRQPYDDADIGEPKAYMLAQRLGRIRPGAKIFASVADVRLAGVLCGSVLDHFDLIIDATANRSVGARIERSRRDNHFRWPALVTVAISQTATQGIATVTPPGTIGAGIDLLRRLGLTSSEDRDLADVYREFFPPPEDRSSIRPEPGCSDSTFVGSATDVSVLAAQLLDSAIGHTDREKVQVSVSGTAELIAVPKTICVARLGRDDMQRPARAVLTLPHDWVLQDTGGHYEVRLDEHAVDQMGGIVGQALSGDQPGAGHTGGLLLGQFDDACGVVWVSEVTGPPRGSTVSPHELQLNVAEAGEHVRERGRATGGLLAHVGYWHTHPGASATPSELDRQQMEDPPSPAGTYPPRVLFLIMGLQGGGSLAEDRSSGWVRDVYAHVIFPD